MTIEDVYKKLRIPINLQEHHLRVGALIHIITDAWQGPEIASRALVLAGLTHDLANIIKFDFSQPSMMGNEAHRIDYWRKVKQEVIDNYGDNIHLATLKMGKEVGLAKEVLGLIERLEWSEVATALETHDWEQMIEIYADMRIGPFGILPIMERVGDLRRRRPQDVGEALIQIIPKLETLLRENTKVNLKTIRQDELEALYSQCLSLEV